MINVFLTPDIQRQIDRLPKVIRIRMLKLVDRLQCWPDISGVKPLSGSLAGHFRMRTGDYRLQFYIRANNIYVEKIGHRAGFYEE
jgi:mRNA-degrading endonuclease RelE of RelBE toxin-antitoxin system